MLYASMVILWMCAATVHALTPSGGGMRLTRGHVQLQIRPIGMALSDLKRVPPFYEPQMLPSMGVDVGNKAPDFNLLPAGGGARVSLSSLLATKPVLLEFASVT